MGIGYVRPDLFLDQLTVIKTDLNFVSVKNITFNSSYNWFKIDILRQLRPLTAKYLAMFIVTSTTKCIQYEAQTKYKTRFHS